MTTRRKTYNITENRQLEMEKLAIEISSRMGKQVRWTDIVTHLIDNYARDAAEDIAKEKKR